jgi:hypothetical protein
MMDADRNLRSALERLAEHGHLVGAQSVLDRAELELRGQEALSILDRARRPRRRWSIAIAAAVITTLVVAAPLVLLGGGAEEAAVVTQPAPESTVATTVAQSPTTEAVAPPGVGPDSWERVGADVMQPVVGLFDMTLAGSRFVAVGFDPGDNSRQDGVIFASDDGVTWTRLAENDPALTTGAVLIYGIAEGGPGLVAVGMGCEDEAEGCSPYATAWTSTDGTSWDRTSYDAAVFGDTATQGSAMSDVIASGGELVAVGSFEYWTLDQPGIEDGVTIHPAVWTSPDGVSWERSWEGEGVDVEVAAYAEVNVSMEAVTEGDNGRLVAVGSILGQAGELIAAVWTSDDGKAWDRIPHVPSIFAGDQGHGLTMWDVAAGESGFVAVGGEGTPFTPAVWTSPDGLTWNRVELDESEFGGSWSGVAALDTGFVAAGPHGFADQSEEPVTLWTSPDGFTWDRVLTLGSGQAQAIVVTDAAIAVAGGLPEDNDFHAAVWVGPAFDPNAPPPEPPLPTPTTAAVTPTTAPIPADGSGAEYLPDIAGALPGDDGVGPLPLGSFEELPGVDYLNFLVEFCLAEDDPDLALGGPECFLDASFMTTDDHLIEGVWTDERPFHVREGFINNSDEPLGEGFDVVMYITRWSGPDPADGSFEEGQTYRFTSDYVLRGTSDRCGPTYETQSGPETCEWFVHDFPNGLPQGRYDMWAVWEAPCSAWVDLGFAEACDDPNEVISQFSSGVNSPFGP